MEILSLENVSFTYPSAKESTVKNVSFSVSEGDFVTLCGPTGCGKTTLLRIIKRELTPKGMLSGEIYFKSRPLSSLTDRECAESIGFVMQSPEHQLVTDKVWHELAFSAENINMDKGLAARRIAEVSAYLGIEHLLSHRTAELSGGQKQLTALASVLVTSPSLVILDEPTSQLDPVSAADFIATLRRINRDMGLTVIISEHRTEELFAVSDKLLFAHDGTLSCIDNLKKIPHSACRESLLPFMPTSTRLFCTLGGDGDCPLDVRSGRRYAEKMFSSNMTCYHAEKRESDDVRRPVVLEMCDVSYRYARDLPDALSSLSLCVREGEIFCIVGGNGSGKSTALAVAAGLCRPYRGQVRIFGKKISEYRSGELYRGCLSMMMQDVQTMFTASTVREELGNFTPPFDISSLYDSHPYDLSGGEAQLVALARALSTAPKLLLLDEPTKGLDGEKKEMFVRLLKSLRENGTTVLCVTHDVEFAAMCADKCAMFFCGKAVSVENTREFFAENSVYTTAARRMTRGIVDGAITLEDLLALHDSEEIRCP